MLKQIPKKITPDPIVDSIVELRFTSSIPKEAILGQFLNLLLPRYPQIRNHNIPEEIRQKEEFRYAVELTLLNSFFSVGIGINVITFNCVNGYKGWSIYFEEIKYVLNLIGNESIFSSFERVGIRYINFFKNILNITNSLDLNIQFHDQEYYQTQQTIFVTQLIRNGFSHRLQVSENAVLNGVINGSLVDIDTYTTNVPADVGDDLYELIKHTREEEKSLFFNLLKSDFVEQFHPEY